MMKAQEKVQEAAHTYQRAVGMFQAAKETITIAEETSMQGRKKRDFDSALQEMLNHATLKVGCGLSVATYENKKGPFSKLRIHFCFLVEAIAQSAIQ